MMVDMIPTVMDSERVERIIGQDGVEKMVEVNKEHELTGDIINDLSKGAYDVEVTIGPNFQSARQEALDTLISFAEAMPSAAPVIQDLIAKNIDSPDAQEMANRLRIPLIQQGLIQPNEQEKAAGVGSQKSQQQQLQEQQQQLEMQLLQGKTAKMSADAQIAQSRAKVSPIEQEKIGYEAAGKHLANIKLAHEIGADAKDRQNDAQSAQMDLAAKHVGNLQDMTHARQQHSQDIAHYYEQHTAAMLKDRAASEEKRRMEREEHEHELRLERERFEHEKALNHDRVNMEMELAREKHALDLKNAKELAAAKSSAARKPKAAKAD
jgi:hypothetical protein